MTTVGGSGPIPCQGMVIGEAPGKFEEEKGVPFVGASGKLLDKALALGGLARADIRVTNVVKERPTDSQGNNRTPTKKEIDRWLPILIREGIEVDPSFVLILGRVACSALFPRTLAQAGGRFGNLRGLSFPRGGRTWMFAWHPAYVLRNPKAGDEFTTDVAMFARAVNQVKESHGKTRIPIISGGWNP